MTNAIPIFTIAILSTILITGGITPYSFANNDDHEYEDDYECEIPSIFTVKYNGPDNAHVEIYKQPKHAKNSQNLIYSFDEYFNDGDYIELNSETHMGKETIKRKTTYKIMHDDSSVIIPINTSCKRPLAVGDVHERDGVSLEVMYGGDLDHIPVIFEKYHYDSGDDSQSCEDLRIDFGGNLVHGSQQQAIQDYLDVLTADAQLNNFNIDYSASSSNGIDMPGAIYDSRNNGGEDEDLEDPLPLNSEIGNLLIIQENDFDFDSNNIWDMPDDEVNGGTHTFTFVDDQGEPAPVDVRDPPHPGDRRGPISG